MSVQADAYPEGKRATFLLRHCHGSPNDPLALTGRQVPKAADTLSDASGKADGLCTGQSRFGQWVGSPV